MAEAKFSTIFYHQRGDIGCLLTAPHIILGVFESRAGFFTEDFCQVFVMVFELLLTAQRQAPRSGTGLSFLLWNASAVLATASCFSSSVV